MDKLIKIKGIPAELYRRGRPVEWTPTTKEKMTYKAEETDTYKPLTHINVLEILIDTLTKLGQSVDEIRINLGRGLKSGMVARLLVTDTNTEFKDMWTIVHGHNRRSSIKVASGLEVVACANGCIFATEILSAMHTKNVVDTYHERLSEFVTQSLLDKPAHLEVVDRFKNTPITTDMGKLFVINAALDELVRRPVKVVRSFIENGDLTVWGLWQAITFHEEICSEPPLNRADDQFRLLIELADSVST